MVCHAVLGQTPAARLQGVHAQHEAWGARVAVLHTWAGPGRVQLVAGAVLLVLVKAVLALALRLEGGVVEGQDVTQGTGTSGVQLVAGLCALVVVHLEALVAAAEALACAGLHDDDCAVLAGSLAVLLVTVAVLKPRPEDRAGALGGLGLGVPNKPETATNEGKPFTTLSLPQKCPIAMYTKEEKRKKMSQ